MEFLSEYLNLVVLALCLGVGYIIKNSLDFIPNKYIPLFCGVIGIVANILNAGISNTTLLVVVEGLISGLAATGAFELVRNTINKED